MNCFLMSFKAMFISEKFVTIIDNTFECLFSGMYEFVTN